MPSKWKSVKWRAKQQKAVRLALVTAAILAALFLAGAVISLINMLTSPWQLEAQKNYSWDGSFNINVAVKGASIALLSFNPVQKKLAIIRIPSQTYLDVPGGFGRWQIRSVYDLGQGQLLERTLTSFLGIPVDGFIQLKGNLAEKEAEDLVYYIRQNPLNLFLSLNIMVSDLTPVELLQLNFRLFQVRYDKINSINLESSLVLDKVALADQTEVLTGDPVRIDSITRVLTETRVLEEHKSIAVFNAIERALIAQKAARIITNLGGNVIQISNASYKLDKTRVWGEESATLQRLRQIFGCCDKIEANLEGISSRAQINVVLGEDFFLKLGN